MLYEIKEYDGFNEINNEICWKITKLVDEESVEAKINKIQVLDITRIFSELYSVNYILNHSICLDILAEHQRFNTDFMNFPGIKDNGEQMLFLGLNELHNFQKRQLFLQKQVSLLNDATVRMRH